MSDERQWEGVRAGPYELGCLAVAISLALSGCASTGVGGQQLRQAAPAYASPPARAPSPVRMGTTYRPVGTTLYGVGEAAPHAQAAGQEERRRNLIQSARDCINAPFEVIVSEILNVYALQSRGSK